MFATGDMVRDLNGEAPLSGRVVHVFMEIAGDETEQVITVQPMGTTDEAMRFTRLARELDLLPGHLVQDEAQGWSLV